jgi:hypothetical protein
VQCFENGTISLKVDHITKKNERGKWPLNSSFALTEVKTCVSQITKKTANTHLAANIPSSRFRNIRAQIDFECIETWEKQALTTFVTTAEAQYF